MKTILVTGHCGYTGQELVKLLLKENYKVIGIDTMWYGKSKIKDKNLVNIKLDLREIGKLKKMKFDTVIHLANIANDPSVELNETLSWNVNVLATFNLLNYALSCNAKQIIFASSGSVYGIKKEKKVTEKLSLLPISIYNKTKMVAESVLLSKKNKIKIHCIRPATVCGLSDRMRYDVSVNMLTYQAVKKKKITVFGGTQIRPNIHIKDLSRIYLHFIKNKSKIDSGCFNAGFENLSIKAIAEKIAKKTKCKIVIKKNYNDPRSYRLSSEKLLKTGFEQKYNVDFAIDELIKNLLESNIKISPKNFNVKWLKKIIKHNRKY